MTTYIGIEQNTDSKCERTVIVKFGARRAAAIKWGAQENLGFAFPGAARNDISGQQQNWHHRLRAVYAMPSGYKMPNAEAKRQWEARRGSVYRGSIEDNLARLIYRDREDILDCSEAAAVSS